MDKTLSIFFFSLFFFAFVQAQTDTLVKKSGSKIENITSKGEIEQLLKSIDPSFSTFRVNNPLKFLNDDCNKLNDSLHCTSWVKADFDNNGYTDLLAVGGWDDHAIFCILDSGNNKFSVNRITRKVFQNCTLPFVKRIGKDNVILYYSLNESINSVDVDTLIYKFGDFVEYHSSSKDYEIQKIEYESFGCYGVCPQFKLMIDSGRNAQYSAKKYNNQYGDFQGVIDDTSYRQLIQLLNYIDFPDLKNTYDANWKDIPFCKLKISYNNGEVKIIDDNGMLGTFGLERAYAILFGLRDSQHWEKVLPGEKK